MEHVEQPPAEQPPRLRIGFAAEFYHVYLTPLMRSKRGTLTLDGLPRLPAEDDALVLLERFRAALSKRQLDGSGRATQRATLSLLWPRFQLSISLWMLVGLATDGAQPFLIATLVRELRTGTGSVGTRLGIVAAIGALCLVNTASLQQVLWFGSRCGMRAKVGLSAAVYHKMMRLELGSVASWSSSAVSNLVAIDLARLELSAMFFCFTWGTPLCLVMCATLAGVRIGVAALPGIAFLVALLLAQRAFGWRTGRLRARVARATDARVKLMQDVLLGATSLKIHAWEGALERRLRALRAVEHADIKAALYTLTTLEAAIFFAPGVATFCSLLTHRYALPDEPLEVEDGFAVLSIFAILVKQLNIFPRALKALDEQRVSFQRVERFLRLPELRLAGDGAAGEPKTSEGTGPRREGGGEGQAVASALAPLIVAERACGQWLSHHEPAGALPTRAAPEFVLRDITLSVGKGELHLLCGPIGCGKSSVLLLLLGEMRRTGGRMSLSADESGVGYVPQAAWIVNASFRDNILMGRPLDEAWYEEVIRCCALLPDQLRIGADSLIGERGVTVSGGQRARISLARAVYGRPRVLLLDDPLSAVDAHVARTLVDECLCGVVRSSGAAVLLATHQVQLANALADVVHVMEEGAVTASGRPADLSERGLLPAEGGGEGGGEAEPQRAVSGAAAGESSGRPDATVAGPEASRAEAKGPLQLGEPSKAELGHGSRRAAVRFYWEAMGGAARVVPVLGLVLGLATCRALADWSLGEWIRKGSEASGAVLYGALIGATVVLGLAQGVAIVDRIIGASTSIHASVLSRVLRAPKSWFDATPQGLVLAIFSKDQDAIDDLLPATMLALLKCCIIVATALALGVVAVPVILVVLPIVGLLFRWLTNYFQVTASQLKRLDKASSGPVISRFAETYAGLASVRAMRLQERLGAQLIDQLARNHAAHFLWTAAGRWLAVRLDWVATGIVVCVGAGVVLEVPLMTPSPTLAGLALVYILQITSLFQWGFRMWAEVQNHFVSVERALSYTQVPQEAPAELEGDAELSAASWPQRGAISFRAVEMRYRPGMPLVLRGLSCEIEPGLKSALVGRTGAGKSSILNALFRLVEIEAGGAVCIDGVDVSRVGLDCLRRSMVAIQQDAVLFAGTLRSNLDPLEQQSDARLLEALRKVDFERALGARIELGSSVSDGGSNLSSGSRQLLMLARAMLSSARILVMDEATASCDFDTDAAMQAVVRSHFCGATILTVAHRLDTILDYDRVFVMSSGALAESGSPAELMERPDSSFAQLVAQAGRGSVARFTELSTRRRPHTAPPRG